MTDNTLHNLDLFSYNLLRVVSRNVSVKAVDPNELFITYNSVTSNDIVFEENCEVQSEPRI